MTRVIRRTMIAMVICSGVFSAYSLTMAGLPEIGSPSSRGLTYGDERRLGEVILTQLRAHLPLVTDIELNNYLSSLGAQLGAVPAASRLDFHFLLSDNRQVNAFATPGGIIAINSGLFAQVDNESQLVAVLAHEITHVDRRHLPRLLALSKDLNWLSVASAVVGLMAAIYNPALGAISSRIGSSIPIERQLAYSRSFEREADKFGIELMAKSGFDPQGMPDFLNHLSRLSSNARVPEFLLTHPLSNARVAEAAALAERHHGEYRNDSSQFQYARARLIALLNPKQVLSGDAVTVLELYRRAVAMTTVGNATGATNVLRALRRREPKSLPIELAYMQALLLSGVAREAFDAGENLKRLYPYHEEVVYYTSKALLMMGESGRALSDLRELTRHREVKSALISQLMAEAASREKMPWLEKEFLGDYYAKTGRLRAAVEQYQAAANQEERHATEARVAVKKKRLEELLERMK